MEKQTIIHGANAISPDSVGSLKKFSAASRRFQPNPIRLLFIAEAPPAYSVNRLFYFANLSDGDTLFLELMKVLYPTEVGFVEGAFQSGFSAKEMRKRKEELLNRFMEDGYYLIDASEQPLPGDASVEVKLRLVENALPELRRRVKQLIAKKTPIVLIGAITYAVCADALRRDGHAVLNTGMINHPARGGQRLFRAKMSAMLSRRASG